MTTPELLTDLERLRYDAEDKAVRRRDPETKSYWQGYADALGQIITRLDPARLLPPNPASLSERPS